MLEVRSSIPFNVVGSGRSSLIVETREGIAFIHNKEVAYLMMHPGAQYEIVTRPRHKSIKFGQEVEFPEAKWVCVLRPTIGGFSV